jgi:hypothetical protein
LKKNDPNIMNSRQRRDHEPDSTVNDAVTIVSHYVRYSRSGARGLSLNIRPRRLRRFFVGLPTTPRSKSRGGNADKVLLSTLLRASLRNYDAIGEVSQYLGIAPGTSTARRTGSHARVTTAERRRQR